jgi:hypothetical protein
MSKPLVLAEAGPIKPGTGPMMAVVAKSMSSPEAIIGPMPSMLIVGEAPSMMVSMTDDALSMVGGTLSMAVSMAVLMTMLVMIGALSMAVVGEGPGESIDPDPVIPTVGAN